MSSDHVDDSAANGVTINAITNVINITNVVINNIIDGGIKRYGYGPARRRVFAAALLALLLPGCGGRSGIDGTWDKVQSAPCAEVYPEKLVFLDDGSYVGGLLLWNGGKYDLIDDKRIKLETRTGPGLYEFDLSGNRLTFKTDWSCSVKYAKRD